MKYKILLPLLLVSILQFSCEQATGPGSGELYFPPLPTFTIEWNEQNTLVCFGTSLTYGFGAGEKRLTGGIGWVGGGGGSNNSYTGDSSYPRFLQEKLKIKVLNKGYVGARTSYALSILNDSVLSQKPALILLEFGANDFLWNTPAHVTDSLLSVLITQIQQRGIKVVLLNFVHRDMLQYVNSGGWTAQDSLLALDYISMLTSVAQRFSLPNIEYPLQGVFGHPTMMSDELHPNGIGYKRMEENIYVALSLAFQKNGMVKEDRFGKSQRFTKSELSPN